jgi:UDP-N-acetylmuramyl pentapeptide phosphotransferase/UDP-N-acetylglucosamine-1-phosphate transferase
MLPRTEWTILIPAALVIFVVTWAAVEAIRRWAVARALLDVPNARSSHKEPTPRLGGVAMAAVITAALLAASAYLPDEAGARLLPLVLTAAVISIVSLFDDLYGLPAPLRLAVQIAAAILIVWALGPLRTVKIPGFALLWDLPVGPIALVGWLLPILWLVGFTNAFNFMDGIDGLAGAQALVCSVTWIIIGSLTGEPTLVALGMAIAAASAGFLLHNWSPARIFMGDAGSAYLGLLLAGAPLTPNASTPFVAAAVLMAWPFIFDTLLTLLRRARRGENLLTPHRTHLYQRLTRPAPSDAAANADAAAVHGGASHARVVLLYAALAAAGGATAVFDFSGRPVLARLGMLGLPIAAGALWTLVAWRERRGARNGEDLLEA